MVFTPHMGHRCWKEAQVPSFVAEVRVAVWALVVLMFLVVVGLMVWVLGVLVLMGVGKAVRVVVLEAKVFVVGGDLRVVDGGDVGDCRCIVAVVVMEVKMMVVVVEVVARYCSGNVEVRYVEVMVEVRRMVMITVAEL
ncbi:unnamed protein product [Boreogadus saida]